MQGMYRVLASTNASAVTKHDAQHREGSVRAPPGPGQP